MTLTKEIIANRVARQCGVSAVTSKSLFDGFIDTIVEAMENNDKVVISNFGVFQMKRRAPRTGRNPHTGQAVPIPERYVISFKPSKNI